MPYHRLLARQLKRFFNEDPSLLTDWHALIAAVDKAYREADEDRSMLERSLELSSQELLQVNSEMRAVVQAFPDIFFLLDPDGTIRDYKGGSASNFYLPPQQLVGKRIQDIPLGAVSRQFDAALQEVGANRTNVSLEYSLTMHGQADFYEARLVPIHERQILAIVRNISERKRNDEALHASEEKFRLITETIGEMFWMADAELRTLLYVSPSYERIWGRPAASLYRNPTSFLDAVHPDDRERVSADLKAQLTGRPFDHEYRILHPDGAVRWIWNRGYPVCVNAQQRVTYVGVAEDITERKQAEVLLQESERNFRSLIEAIPQQVWAARPDGTLDYVNQRVLDYFDRKAEDVIKWQWQDVVHPDDLPECMRRWARALNTGCLYEVEFRLKDARSGAYRWHIGRALPLTDQQGRIVKWFGTNTDITERKQVEETLTSTKTLLEATFSGMHEAVLVVDPKTRTIVKCNRATTRIFGYEEDELIGRTTEFLHVDRARFEEYGRQLFPALDAHGVFHVEFSMRRKDGSIFVSEQTVSEIRTPANERVLVVNVLRDVTDRVTLEERLRQAQKMEAVGRLAGGIAHDFNNLLTVINGYSDVTLVKLPLPHPLRANVERIRAAGKRAARLTQQILAFSRQQTLMSTVFNLNDAVDKMDALLYRLIGENIVLVVSENPSLGRVRADQGQIEQVIMNLAVNARDAMPDGGTLTFETRNVELDESSAKIPPSVQPGSYVALTVRDTGCGMDAATQARIFEPFFTTKEKDKGTGLGLATVYGIVTQSGGTIRVWSEPGRGSVFTVYLPRVHEPIDSGGPDVVHVESPTGSETVLLVEDEDMVRDMAHDILHEQGYLVLDAPHAAKALEICEKYARPIHLLLTDIVMPGMNGRELANRLLSARPEMKVLYTSGYAEQVLLQQEGVLPRQLFIQKPYAPDALARKIREVLDAPVL